MLKKFKFYFIIFILSISNIFAFSEADIPDVGSYTNSGGALDMMNPKIVGGEGGWNKFSQNLNTDTIGSQLTTGNAGSLAGWSGGMPAIPGPSDFKIMIQADWSRFIKSWRLKGVKFCRKKWKIKICLNITHYFPTGIVETTKKSNKSKIKSPFPMAFLKIIATASSKALKMLFGYKPSAGAGHGAGSGHQTNFSFFNATVYNFPNFMPYLEQIAKYNPSLKMVMEVMKRTVCYPLNVNAIMPFYSTQSDFLIWRTGLTDMGKVMTFRGLLSGAKGCSDISFPGSNKTGSKVLKEANTYCIGNYGPIYPRTGWGTQFNEPTAAVVTSFRAINLAHRGGSVKMSPYAFNIATGGYLQQLQPQKSKCYRIQGNYTSHPGFKKKDRDGNYMYVHWPKVGCCHGCFGIYQAGH